MKEQILHHCLKKGILLDSGALNFLDSFRDFAQVAIIIEKIDPSHGNIITKNILSEQIINNEEKKEEKRFRDEDYKLIEPRVDIVSSWVLPARKIVVGDFVKHFRSRFIEISKIIQSRTESENLASINRISGNRQNVSIIGIVSDKRITKNKNILLEIEDLTGRTVCLVNQNKEKVYSIAKDVVLDDIILLRCSGSREMLFVNDIVYPDMFLSNKKKSPVEENVLFTSDLHVGSNKFLEDNFLKFIDWINGKNHKTSDSDKVKYLFIVGDLIDGAGIYPGQEHELNIKTIKDQYNMVAELLSKIRKDVKIILCAGNHDSLRMVEPQPLLDLKYAENLYELKNIIMTTNPSTVNIAARKDFQGFNVMMYHGYSFDYYANNVDYLRVNQAYQNPEMITNFLFKRRHLAPTHSSTLLFPHSEDSMIIKEVPDVFVSGHIHKSGISHYKDVIVISASCWQGRTAFQEKVGHIPDPCKVPLLNLKTRSIKVLDFSGEENDK
ncbi:hypothetical protein COV15_01330 [Candidatus Woesearchaeota archaeon CG10_big_fil_rev_8_21_14_0_10_34_12]|nr:MAG: hypothetical protein COV15_01330 [Candidatus Woesearchaeota archaeon CG10_big_fil_rev_8_21_14_0_10_34_12]